MHYKNKKVLITGGLGFIGSNLAIRAVELGARVTVVDSSVIGCGANRRNLAPVWNDVRTIDHDIGEAYRFPEIIAGSDVIFNLAGEVSHLHSMDYPERDLEINTVAQLRFLEMCRKQAPGIRIVYAGTRQIYGIPEYLPVDESHPIHPVDFNGIHKYAAMMYHLMLSRSGNLDAVVLRLTNVYGPRMALGIPCQGFLASFLRRILLGERLEVFGEGAQKRDPLYVDDVVEAFLLAGASSRLPSRTYNVGGLDALSLEEIAQICTHAVGGCPPLKRPFPKEHAEIDIGSYYSDSSRIERELGWKPQIRFCDGIRQVLDFYRAELPHYLADSNPRPRCMLAK